MYYFVKTIAVANKMFKNAITVTLYFLFLIRRYKKPYHKAFVYGFSF